MKLVPNAFLAGLRSGTPQIGLWSSLAHNFAAEAIAGAGYDWVLIDMEHSPNDLQSVLAQLQVFAAYDTTALVRPAWNDAVMVKQLLDAGAPGLLFPMVQSEAEAGAAVAACRYPPRGIRGVSGTTRANKFGRVTDYFSRIETETAILVQVETEQAVNRATEIGAMDGVDGVFFGPADIAADLGLLGQPLHPDVWAVIMPAATALIKAGIPVGTLVMDHDFARDLIADGFGFVACGSDAGLLTTGADQLLARMKS